MTFPGPFIPPRSPFQAYQRPQHPMALMANMPDNILLMPGERHQTIHHIRRQMRSRAANVMRRDGYSISQIATQLHLSLTTVCGYFRDP